MLTTFSTEAKSPPGDNSANGFSADVMTSALVVGAGICEADNDEDGDSDAILDSQICQNGCGETRLFCDGECADDRCVFCGADEGCDCE